MLPSSQDVAVVIATKDRFPSPLIRALESIRHQALAPSVVILVNDGAVFDETGIGCMADHLAPIACEVVQNSRVAGVAGAWNSGLQTLVSRGHEGFVALLDDDDEWEANHLEANLDAARASAANVVISGLRHTLDGKVMPRPLVGAVCAEDFLSGNPGWQGSNTFINMKLLVEVGGFRDGLQSLNDRDLAFRVLSSPNARVGYTGRWTATWHSRSKATLSSARNPQKLSGLRWFWNLYEARMSETHKEAFFERATRLFGFERSEIIEARGDLPPHTGTRGDLDGQPHDEFQA